MAKKKTQKTSKKEDIKVNKVIIISSILIIAIILIGLVFINNMTKDSSQETIVVLETSKGNIHIELFEDQAPITTQNFLTYVNNDFYNGLVFHRVIEGFMIQGGGFTQDGDQKPTNNPIELETQANLANEKYTIAMARTQNPNSATSQFFINVDNNSFLNPSSQSPGYAVFGKVVEGFEVVDEIAQVETTTKFQVYRDWPVDDIIITRAYVLE